MFSVTINKQKLVFGNCGYLIQHRDTDNREGQAQVNFQISSQEIQTCFSTPIFKTEEVVTEARNPYAKPKMKKPSGAQCGTGKVRGGCRV